MTKVFIVRPFGDSRSVLKKKAGTEEYTQEKFNFDKVETDLIRPAMKATGLIGGPTTDVFAAGDIRQDMFSSLLLDDLIIADITIHNANVFYELGIRHALRDKRTILIKCPGYDDTPFDILTYKYVSYTKDDPAKALGVLIQTIKETVDPENDRKDSPVFNVLPSLQPQDPERYLAVPGTFAQRVAIAAATKDLASLETLGTEAADLIWERPAFRLLGEAFFAAKEYGKAMTYFEKILGSQPLDRQANDRLATIYQRLAEADLDADPTHIPPFFAKSDLAIENLLSNNTLTAAQQAEAIALQARNAKTRWIYSWKGQPDKTIRQKKALASLDLTQACDLYEKGCKANLDHFYSGINALALLLVTIELAKRFPAVWELRFKKEVEATRALEDLHARYKALLPVEEYSIAKTIEKAAADPDKRDRWAEISYADLICLTATSPEKVGFQYTQATTDAADQYKEAAKRQLQLFQQLDILPENVAAALAALP